GATHFPTSNSTSLTTITRWFRFPGPTPNNLWNTTASDSQLKRSGSTRRAPAVAPVSFGVTPKSKGRVLAMWQTSQVINDSQIGTCFFLFDDGTSLLADVAQYKANPWKLYDIVGNVSEWCQDSFAKDYPPDGTDETPVLGDKNSPRVLRGGSWLDAPD